MDELSRRRPGQDSVHILRGGANSLRRTAAPGNHDGCEAGEACCGGMGLFSIANRMDVRDSEEGLQDQAELSRMGFLVAGRGGMEDGGKVAGKPKVIQEILELGDVGRPSTCSRSRARSAPWEGCQRPGST